MDHISTSHLLKTHNNLRASYAHLLFNIYNIYIYARIITCLVVWLIICLRTEQMIFFFNNCYDIGRPGIRPKGLLGH